MGISSRRIQYARKISAESGWSFLKAYKELERVHKSYDISYKRYLDERFFEKPETWIVRRSETLKRRAAENENIISEISEESGIPVADIKADISFCRKLYGGRLGAPTYRSYQIYKMTEDEKRAFINDLKKKDEFVEAFKRLLSEYDDNPEVFSDLSKIEDELKLFLRGFLSETRFEELCDLLKVTGVQNIRDVAADMEATLYLLNLSYKEYIMFRLWDKNLSEKLEYIPDGNHTPMILHINGTEISALCNDKYKTYTKLEPYYRREMILITSTDDADLFLDYGRRHPKAVLKPYSSTKGKGVRLFDFEDELSEFTRDEAIQIIDNLLSEDGEFVLEELVHQHESLSVFNPDSVNTLRILSYYDGDKVTIDGSLLRVGRAGAFVDNGGAGGILIGIDAETGRLNTGGFDQAGNIFGRHPDTNVEFMDYQLPDWDAAVRLIENVSKELGQYYIGWDITCTEDGNWIVIEANGTPQFFGKQSTTGKGALPDFRRTVGEERFKRIV